MSRRARPAGPVGGLVAAALGAGAARIAYAALQRRPPGGAAVWERANHRGDPVTLLAGPAVAAAATAASALSPRLPARARAAVVAAGAGAAAFGCYDDVAGGAGRRGFRGHLGALARGEVTTGTVKIAGIGAAGAAAGMLLGGTPADVVVNAGLTAGAANLLNLFDLRPGRAIKVALAGGTLLAVARGRGGPQRGPRAARLAGPVGAALALLPDDLGERAMLGDTGANALGALLGVGAAMSLPRPARMAVLAGIAGLTGASEVVSFTAVIERTPALRRLDMLGRRPLPARATGDRRDGATRAAGNGGQPGPSRPPDSPAPQGTGESGHAVAAASP